MRVDLRALSTHVLVEALGRIEKGQAQPPWSSSLGFTLPAVAAALAPLDGVPSLGVVALISAVLDERGSVKRAAEVVWTGPEPVAPTSRDKPTSGTGGT